jgi:hypothetical protein
VCGIWSVQESYGVFFCLEMTGDEGSGGCAICIYVQERAYSAATAHVVVEGWERWLYCTSLREGGGTRGDTFWWWIVASGAQHVEEFLMEV